MVIETIAMPAHWACYIVNGDSQGLAPGEAAHIDRFIEGMDSLSLGDGESFFSWGFDSWFDPDTRGGDLLDFQYVAR